MSLKEPYLEVFAERLRQDEKWGPNLVRQLSPERSLAVLHEETGEAARAVLDVDRAGLRKELVQVAAVAIAWIERLDAQEAARAGAVEAHRLTATKIL